MVVFVVLAVVMLVGALGVVLLRHPVHAALSLVGTLLTLAVAYVQLHAHFLAAIQVIVYAGAIMVLFLFVIMLLAVKGEERSARLRWIGPAAWAVGVAAAAGLVVAVLSETRPLPSPAELSAVFTGSGIEGLADQLFGPFLLVFQLVGVLLLTGIVAAVGLVQRTSEPVELRPAMPPTPKGRPHEDASAAREPAVTGGGR
jgi:NADH-quinone oxidoreductase subunit J